MYPLARIFEAVDEERRRRGEPPPTIGVMLGASLLFMSMMWLLSLLLWAITVLLSMEVAGRPLGFPLSVGSAILIAAALFYKYRDVRGYKAFAWAQILFGCLTGVTALFALNPGNYVSLILTLLATIVTCADGFEKLWRKNAGGISDPPKV